VHTPWLHRGGTSAASPSPTPAYFRCAPAPCMHTRSLCAQFPTRTHPERARRQVRRRRAAPAAARAAPLLAPPHCCPRWFTHAALVLQDQTRVESSPGQPSSAISSEASPRERRLWRPAPPPVRPTHQSRPIRGQRIRLDPDPICSEPPDSNPTAEIHPYRFSLAILLKCPSASLLSTRCPS
jgi:hypothetical protein